MGAPARFVSYMACHTHGKRLYPSRKEARRCEDRIGHAGARAYRCDVLDGWHVGHLPSAVREGVEDAAGFYGGVVERVYDGVLWRRVGGRWVRVGPVDEPRG